MRLDVTVGPSMVTVTNATEIAHGYAFGLNQAAFVEGPTGLAFDAQAHVLYVASTSDNQIFGIPNAVVERSTWFRWKGEYFHAVGPSRLYRFSDT